MWRLVVILLVLVLLVPSASATTEELIELVTEGVPVCNLAIDDCGIYPLSKIIGHVLDTILSAQI